METHKDLRDQERVSGKDGPVRRVKISVGDKRLKQAVLLERLLGSTQTKPVSSLNFKLL